jgi:hypothetical protein
MSNASNPMNPKDELASVVSEMYLDEQKANVEQEARRHLDFWRTCLDETADFSAFSFERPPSLDPKRRALVYVALRVPDPVNGSPWWYLTGNPSLASRLSSAEFIELLVSWRVQAYRPLIEHTDIIMPVRAAIEARVQTTPIDSLDEVPADD